MLKLRRDPLFLVPALSWVWYPHQSICVSVSLEISYPIFLIGARVSVSGVEIWGKRSTYSFYRLSANSLIFGSCPISTFWDFFCLQFLGFFWH